MPTASRYSCSNRASSSGAEIPLIAEPAQSLVELLCSPVAFRIRPGDDRRAVVGLEVLAVLAGAREGSDLEAAALHHLKVDAVAE